MRRKIGVMLGLTAALIVGGAANATSAAAAGPGAGATPSASALPVCSANPPSGSGWVIDSSYTECRKCQEAGARLEATGKWRTYCMIGGGVGPVFLLRYCVACLSTEAG